MRLPQSKVVKELPGSATIKGNAKEYQNQVDLGSITIERTAMDCHIQNDCQGVPQSKEMSGDTTINMTAREYHN